jgi:hypothetical protein
MLGEHGYDARTGLLLFRVRGTLTAGEIGQECVLIDTDPAYTGLRTVIVDLSDVVDIDLDAETVKKLAAFVRSGTYHRPARACVVAPRTFHYGMCRMLASYAEMGGVRIEVFRTLREATAWANRDQAVTA